MFALAAQRLSIWFEHGQWPTEGRAPRLPPTGWPAPGVNVVSAEAVTFGTSATVACMVALLRGRAVAVHEMMEALDPNY